MSLWFPTWGLGVLILSRGVPQQNRYKFNFTFISLQSRRRNNNVYYYCYYSHHQHYRRLWNLLLSKNTTTLIRSYSGLIKQVPVTVNTKTFGDPCLSLYEASLCFFLNVLLHSWKCTTSPTALGEIAKTKRAYVGQIFNICHIKTASLIWTCYLRI